MNTNNTDLCKCALSRTILSHDGVNLLGSEKIIPDHIMNKNSMKNSKPCENPILKEINLS